jgi:alpha-glucosidase
MLPAPTAGPRSETGQAAYPPRVFERFPIPMPRATMPSRSGPHASTPRAHAVQGLRYAPGMSLAKAEGPGLAIPAGVTVTRYRDPRHAETTLPPFPAYETQPVDVGPASHVTGVRPGFADTGNSRLVRIGFDRGTSLYGTGEQAGGLLRNGTRKTCWNTDAFGYTDANPSLYQSHPWVLALRADGSAYGFLCETTWRCVIDCGKTDPSAVIFEAEGPSPALTVIEGPNAEAVLGAFAALTGTIPMPPLWALGYQQCRWSYEPESRVREIAKGFRDRRIPCDVIWLDIDYMDRFRCFTFDAEKFPDPARMNADLHAMGFKSVWMIDPGLAVDPEYAVYKKGHEAGHFVTATRVETSPTSVLNDETATRWGVSTAAARSTVGGEYQGRVWPGPCAFPDFTRAGTRAWWAGLYKAYMATGIDGVWNDMNEPAVFDGDAKTMPGHCHHEADADLGGPGPHAKYHNLYGMQMVRATRDGIAAANPQKRPFVLTRANFLGGHRYAATWTGDNSGTIDHLRWSVSMVLNLGLSGQAFSGPDIGGFAGDVDGATFARWMGVGALLPFARGHKVKDATPHEPWSFGPEVEASCRRALVRRYRLLPFLYTLFDEASRTGMPICRPVWTSDPTDPRLRAVDNAFLLGRDVLVVAPVDGRQDPDPSAALPSGVWRAFDLTETGVVPGHADDPWLPRLFLRAGATLPIGPAAEHTGQTGRGAAITLLVSPDEGGRAAGTLYEDAGEGYGYRTGDLTRTRFEVVGGRVSATPARDAAVVVLAD